MFFIRRSFMLLAAILMIGFVSGCRSTGKNAKETQESRKKAETRKNWAQIQQELEDERRTKRLSSDLYHTKADKFQVFPGRSGSRSERMSEEGVHPIPALW